MPATPIVVLTGVQGVRLTQEAIEERVQDCLPKADLSAEFLSRTIRYGLVRDHGRRMTVESVSDEGTRFFANLPLDRG